MSTEHKHRKIVSRIPAGNQYEGYVWMSDEQKPKVYHQGDAFTEDFSPDATPFVVEGWLYDQANDTSYAIRYLDGKYIRVKYDLSAAEQDAITYQAHDLQPETHFRVKEYWAPKPDPNCAGMDVLRHAWTAFAGFANPPKK
ncbi:TIGR04423 family type III CRISPR-associated protein [Neolewinella agarilytica]|uniref:CRISPR type III-associated protein, TIGR04423 family n=1 Tax=Neolewinella agarilytica TaxID=478744 RepID=A0A1H8Z845_9BACT|nr:TIGR04423 family type III CRISPR-associated protein [Neolewinella agarilytica]SEP60605.1 CRISPR type III-associated protein, TIGR04423 family [Neolewinella agarilytica]